MLPHESPTIWIWIFGILIGLLKVIWILTVRSIKRDVNDVKRDLGRVEGKIENEIEPHVDSWKRKAPEKGFLLTFERHEEYCMNQFKTYLREMENIRKLIQANLEAIRTEIGAKVSESEIKILKEIKQIDRTNGPGRRDH